MLRFRTPTGGVFDGVALNIEAHEAPRRRGSGRAGRWRCARRVDAEAGETPLAIVPFNPRGLERRPSTWPRFPWKELAAEADAFAPMAYTGGAYRGFDATYGYVTRAIRLLRAHTGDPDVAIHVAGGVADRMGPGGACRLRGCCRGRRRYDRRQPLRLGHDAPVDLAGPRGSHRLAHASRRRSRVASRCSGSTFTSARTGMKFVSPDQRGTTCRWTWSTIPAPAGPADVPAQVEAVRGVTV